MGDAEARFEEGQGASISGGLEWLDSLLGEARGVGASDLHLAEGEAAAVRVHGSLQPLSSLALAQSNLASLPDRLLSAPRRQLLRQHGACDVAWTEPDGRRCRVHLFLRGGGLAAAIRLLDDTLPCGFLEEAWVEEVVVLRRGLVLIVGATGSGKSTTLAGLVDRMNRGRHAHIVTLEDPIEHVHGPGRARISQRELHRDVPSYAQGLRGVLRQDPDVVMIGEIRDRETMEAALSVAETGHLVLSTLHTGSAVEAIRRVIDMFPPGEQGSIRGQLADVLEVVVCQRLLARMDGSGRVAAREVLRPTSAIRNLIREGKLHQLPGAMELGHARSGSRTMAQCLAELRASGVIAKNDADSLDSWPVSSGPRVRAEGEV